MNKPCGHSPSAGVAQVDVSTVEKVAAAAVALHELL
jgi:hypothetical protein